MTLKDLVNNLIGILNDVIIPVIFALAFVVFLFGIARAWIFKADDVKVRDQGKQLVIWGLVAFFVMISFWGLVELLRNTFFNPTNTPTEQTPLPGTEV